MFLRRFFRDPLVRRFISASVFASAFVWVAVRFFEVDTEVVWVLFVLSVVFVVGTMVLGFLFSFLYAFYRRRKSGGGMLDRLPAGEDPESGP